VTYTDWVKHAYPLVLLQIPAAVWLLRRAFRPEVTELHGTLVALRRVVHEAGSWNRGDVLTVVVFALTLLAWTTLSGSLGLGIIAMAGASVYLVIGLVQWEDYNTGVNWGVILLYAATISLGVAMKETGAAEWLASRFLDALPGRALASPLLVLALMGAITILFTSVMSNGPAVAVLGPVFLNTAHLTGIGILAAGFVTALSSAFAFMTPTGTPAARILYASGNLQVADFRRAGPRLTAVSLALLLALAFLYWPVLGPESAP
jgi:sodium-dependent dicarboxylate transporter 2/3/5